MLLKNRKKVGSKQTLYSFAQLIDRAQDKPFLNFISTSLSIKPKRIPKSRLFKFMTVLWSARKKILRLEYKRERSSSK